MIVHAWFMKWMFVIAYAFCLFVCVTLNYM